MSSRITIAAVVLLATLTALFFVPGCEPKAKSPFSGEMVTGSMLAVEAAKYDAESQARDLREQTDAERELRKLRADALIEAKRLANSNDTAVTELQAKTDAAAQDVVDRLASNRQARELEASSMQSGVDAAIASINLQNEQRQQLFGIASSIPAAQALPGFGIATQLLPILLGGGLGAGAIQIGKRKVQAELASTKAAAARIVDSIDVLKTAEPNVAAAFDAHSDLLDEWQGEAGKALVNALQK